MKNLKKILMALLLVALMVSAVATVAIAEASYTGTVEEAQKLLDAAVAAKPAEGGDAADAKIEPLKKLYAYLLTVNPGDEGYNEIKEVYNQMTFKVAHSLYLKVDGIAALEKKSAAITAVHAYIAAAPVIREGAEDFSYSKGFVCETCGRYREFTEEEFCDGITASTVCPGVCTKEEQKLSYTTDADKCYSYIKFEKELNDTTFAFAGNIVAYLYGMSDEKLEGTASYYEVRKARKAVLDYLAKINEQEYKAPVSAVYTGDVTVAMAMLDAIGEDATFDELKTALAGVYTYLTETPVNPTLDEFAGFIDDYNAFGGLLIKKLADAVDECETVEDKIAAIAGFRTYLNGTEEAAGTQISEKVVNLFNEYRAEFIEGYRRAGEAIGNLKDLEAAIPEAIYNTDFADFVAALDAAEALEFGAEELDNLIVTLYGYVSEGAFDPTADTYEAATQRYINLSAKYVKAAFVDEYYATDYIKNKVGIIANFLSFINETPLCEAVTDMYAELLADIVAKAKAVDEAIDVEALPEYEEPAKEEVTSVGAVLNSLLDKVISAYAAYESAADDAKAAALNDTMTCLSALGTYIQGNGIDEGADYYGAFVERYNVTRKTIADNLLNIVINAEEGKKAEALATVKACFEKAPVLATSVAQYNEIVAATVTDDAAKAELTLYNVYIELSELVEEIFAEDATAESILANGKKFAACEKKYIDVTDEIYVDYAEARGEVYELVAQCIADTLPGLLEAATAEECVAIVAEYVAYAKEVNNKTVIDGVNNTLAEEDYFAISLVEESKEAVYLTAYDKFLAEIAKFDAAETLADKQAAFKTAFETYNSSKFMTTELMIGDSYSVVVADYARAVAELEAEMLSLINSSADPNKLVEILNGVYDYVSIVRFSKAVNEAYAAKVLALKGTDFGEYADTLVEVCDVAEYKTPENFTSYFARVNLALQLAYEEYGVNDKFTVAYNILSGVAGVEGPDYAPKAIDFGAEAFMATYETFKQVKVRVVEASNDSLANDELEEQLVTLANLKDFITKYPYSKEIHEFYSEMGHVLGKNYREESAATTQKFETVANLLNSYIKNCPINQTLLSAIDRSKYQSILTLAEISELVIVESAIEVYEEVSGEGLNFIHKNTAADSVNRYVKLYGLTDANDSMIASANLKFAFEEFIIKFAKEIENLDATTKEREIAHIGNYLVANEFPAEFVALYESAFGVDNLEAASYSGEITAGDVVELLAKAEAIKLSGTTESIISALADAVSYANSHSFSTTGVLDDLQVKIDAIDAYMAERTEKQITELEKKSKVEEQSYAIFHNYNHEDSAGLTGKMGGTGSHDLITGETNNYAQFFRPGDANAYHALYTSTLDRSKGLVFEMDLMSPGNLSYTIYESNVLCYLFKFTDGMLDYTTGSSYDTEEYPNYRQGVHEPIKTVPGEWIHVAVALDFDEGTIELIIDYVSLGKKTLPSKSGMSANDFAQFRLNPTAANSVVCYDNFKIYSGTTYRTIGKDLTAEEQFNNSVLAMLDETSSVVARTRSYYAALALRNFVGDECAEQKALFDAFDPSGIIEEANAAALAELKALAAGLDVDNMTTADVVTANKTVEKIQAYINTNRQVLDQTSEELLAISKMIIEVAEKNVWLENLSTAVSHLGRFHRATTVASIMKHYNLFKTYYDLCELYRPENMARAENDPVCKDFLTKISSDESVTDILDEVTFEAYCSVYIPGRMLIHNCYENSLKIMDCMAFIKTVAQDESAFDSTEAYYAELVAKAKENYDYVETYLSIVRQIVKSGAYDETVEGVREALEVYAVLDFEFAEILKATHYAAIKAEIERYNASNSYIEKAGICIFLENFIAENNVDLSDEEGVQYRTVLEIFKAELPNYKEDYEAVLKANTEAFIAIVKKMESYVNYKDLKPLYDEAMNEYYYSMNVDSDEARAAVETFVKYQDMINEWETNGAMFLGYVSELKSARRQSQKFRALVNAMNYVDGIAEDMEGMTATLKTYSDELAAYNGDIAPVNSEISEVSDVVCSLRTHSVSATILAILQSMMNK